MGYPENGAYMVTAYIIAAVVLVTYATSLYLRLRKVERAARSDDRARATGDAV